MAAKRKCKLTGEYIRKELGYISRNNMFFKSLDAAIEWTKTEEAKNKVKRLKKESEKEQRITTRARKKALLTRSDWIKKVKKACHEYIRERDNGKKCVTCSKILFNEGLGGGFDAGHYRDVARAKNLEFHTLNIHGQCKKCNNHAWGGHDKSTYRAEIVKRIGEEIVSKIDSDNEPRKYTIPDLERLESIFKRKLKLLKKQKVA